MWVPWAGINPAPTITIGRGQTYPPADMEGGHKARPYKTGSLIGVGCLSRCSIVRD